MIKWEYTYREGKALREAINKGDAFGTLVELDRGLKEFIKNIKDKDEDEQYMKEMFEELSDIISGDVEDGEDKLDAYLKTLKWYETKDEYVDSRLKWFYDMCDDWRVWVKM